jgi:hypothetical protein
MIEYQFSMVVSHEQREWPTMTMPFATKSVSRNSFVISSSSSNSSEEDRY